MPKQTEQPEPIMSTVEQLRRARVRQRQKAAVRYRELLLRNDNPEPNDAEELIKAMETLGRHPEDLPGDIGMVRALVAADQAMQRVQELAEPLERAKQTLKETKNRLAAKRAAFEARVSDEHNGAHTAFTKLAAERASLEYAAGQAPRDAWESLVSGRSVEEIRAARRGRKGQTPATMTREQVIAQCQHETVALRYRPIVGTIIERVNSELHLRGFESLTEAEVRKIEGWTVPLRPRIHGSAVPSSPTAERERELLAANAAAAGDQAAL